MHGHAHRMRAGDTICQQISVSAVSKRDEIITSLIWCENSFVVSCVRLHNQAASSGECTKYGPMKLRIYFPQKKPESTKSTHLSTTPPSIPLCYCNFNPLMKWHHWKNSVSSWAKYRIKTRCDKSIVRLARSLGKAAAVCCLNRPQSILSLCSPLRMTY